MICHRVILSKKFLFFLMAVIIHSICCSGQSFEGKIIYRVSGKTPDPKHTSQEIVDLMLNDIDTLAILYVSKNRYKLVTLARDTGLPRIVNQYDPSLNMLYDYQPDSEFVMKFPNSPITYRKKTIEASGQKTLLDNDCSAISLSFSDIRTLVYYSSKFKIDPSDIRVDAPLFLQFIRQAKAIPLKIVMSGNGAIHALEYEATSIIQEELPDNIFELPGKY